MGKYEKLWINILSGKSDHAIRFTDLTYLMRTIGFNERIKGDHFIYYRSGIDEIINLQPKGSQAKAYQVRQVRNLILKYKLEGPNE